MRRPCTHLQLVLYVQCPSPLFAEPSFSNLPEEKILFSHHRLRQWVEQSGTELQKNKRSKEGATRHTWVVGKLRDFPVHRRLCVRGLDRGRWPAPVDDRGLRIWRQTESKRTDRENLLKSHFWTPVTINRLNQAANSIIFRYKGIYSKQRAEQTIKWGKKKRWGAECDSVIWLSRCSSSRECQRARVEHMSLIKNPQLSTNIITYGNVHSYHAWGFSPDCSDYWVADMGHPCYSLSTANSVWHLLEQNLLLS